MNQLVYVSINCGKGAHGRCTGAAFIEVGTEIREPHREARRVIPCECPHHGAATPAQAKPE